MRFVLSLIAILCSAPVAQAQTAITPEDFLDIAEGNTLTFVEIRSGQLVGIEQFLSRSLSVWRRANGGCVYGRITVEEQYVCFRYDDEYDVGPHCWVPFRKDDRLLVRSPQVFEGEVQEVVAITSESLSCPAAPMS